MQGIEIVRCCSQVIKNGIGLHPILAYYALSGLSVPAFLKRSLILQTVKAFNGFSHSTPQAFNGKLQRAAFNAKHSTIPP